MATKKFLSCLVGLIFILSATACQNLGLKTRSEQKSETPQEVFEDPAPSKAPVVEAPEFLQKRAPKLGIILGGGGALSYAQIGFLQELENAKIPIHGIVGLEWGALVGGAYAFEGKAHAVEWKLLKLPVSKFQDKGFFSSGSSSATVKDFDAFLDDVFKRGNTSDLEVSFSCGYTNVVKAVSGHARSGRLKNMIRACWAAEPHFKIDVIGANTTGVEAAARFLKSEGAELVVYVDVLSRNRPFTQEDRMKDRALAMSWLNQRNVLSKLGPGFVDEVVHLPLGNFSMTSYKSLRSIIRTGQLKSKSPVKELVKKYAY